MDLAFTAEQWVSEIAGKVPGMALLAAFVAALLLRRWLRRRAGRSDKAYTTTSGKDT